MGTAKPRKSSGPPPTRAAATVIRIVALYVLAGALAKVFSGHPSDLPAVLQDTLAWDPEGLFFLLIALELITAVIAIIAPAVGWPFLACMLLGFLTVLTVQLGQGEASCGCFGSAAPVPTSVMLALDGLALMVLSLSRPWRSVDVGQYRRWSVAGVTIAVVASVGYITPSLTSASASSGESLEAHDARGDPRPGQWRLPPSLPGRVALRPTSWVGKPIRQTTLATFVDTSEFPANATLILYYETCQHCAKHLGELAANPGDASYVLLQIPTPPDSTLPVRVTEMPPGIHATLPAGIEWRIRTPWDIFIENGVVTKAVKPPQGNS